MKLIVGFAVVVFLFVACKSSSSDYEFWKLSKFNLVDTALADGENIRIIYASQGPDDNKNSEYYFHLVAVSQKTGDTLNILTTLDNRFSTADIDKTFGFFHQGSLISEIVQNKIDSSKEIKNKDVSMSEKGNTITKVARDPKYDQIADNNFPTVIGIVMKVTQ